MEADARPRHGCGSVKQRVLYAVSLTAYILITLFTKRLLTWNLAMLYFVVTIDLLPRLYRRVRYGDQNHVSSGPAVAEL